MNSIKFIIFGTILFAVIMVAADYLYAQGKCCQCCEVKQTTCGNEVCEQEVCRDGCCRCSFIKEYFKIDIYFWE